MLGDNRSFQHARSPLATGLLAATATMGALACSSSASAVAPAPPAPIASPDQDASSLPEPAADAADAGPTLPSGISALAGHAAGLPDDDLAPFGALVGEAMAVGLGESIHTSGGFHDMKSRMVKYLVEKKGFRLLTWEWQRVNGELVDDYLSTCTGSATEAAKRLSVWSSTSVRDMLEWVCTFNQAHPNDRVHFMGFDVQQPQTDDAEIRGFLAANAAADAPGLVADLVECQNSPGSMDYPGDYTKCTAAITAISAYVDAHAASLTSATSAERIALLRIALRSFRAWQDESHSYYTDITQSYEARDLAMADTYRDLIALKYPGVRHVVWAHNYHLRQDGKKVTGAAAIGANTMGALLHQRLGTSYVPIGLVAWDYAVDWPNVGCGPRPHPAKDSMEAALEAIPGGQDLFVDLAFPGASAPFFTKGKEYEEASDEQMAPLDQYRALVFLRDSAAMEPLDWTKCTP